MNTQEIPTGDRSRASVTPQYLVAFGHPIVDITTQRAIGLELLARWRSTNRVLLPHEFLPTIEALDLGPALDNRMVRTAAEFVKRATAPDRGHAASDFQFVSVNVDANHLTSGDLFFGVERAIDATGIDPSALMLEVTEMTDHTGGGWDANVERLRELGVRVAIDDFGTGFSSMTRLIDAPIDMVKVDRSLVQRVDDDGCQALLSGLIEFSSASKTLLVAEGIETPEQAKSIVDLGITIGQGFLYGRPLPLTEILAGPIMLPDDSPVSVGGAAGQRTFQTAC